MVPYDAERQLTLISDDKGRSVKIGWRDGVVESIDGPDGGVRYEYQQASALGQADSIGMARLEAVHFQGREGAVLASRRHHYESESSRYFLTGITDENNVRFVNDVARGLQTRRIAGLKADPACPVTANDSVMTARMTGTQWHPDWPLKSVIAEPNRLTNYVYNGERGADGQIARPRLAPQRP